MKNKKLIISLAAILQGFKFGMLLQFAVGPICFFIFQIASSRGFYAAETGVLGVVIIDGLYILAAILGIGAIIDKKEIRYGLKIFGSIILFIFGLSMVLSQFSIEFLPSFSMQNDMSANSVFLQSIILTASSPLTILFWAGVFSTKIAEEGIKRKEIYGFGFGALLSTMFFLTLIAFLGSLIKDFFPSVVVIQGLNLSVGFLLLCFGVRMVIRNEKG